MGAVASRMVPDECLLSVFRFSPLVVATRIRSVRAQPQVTGCNDWSPGTSIHLALLQPFVSPSAGAVLARSRCASSADSTLSLRFLCRCPTRLAGLVIGLPADAPLFGHVELAKRTFHHSARPCVPEHCHVLVPWCVRPVNQKSASIVDGVCHLSLVP